MNMKKLVYLLTAVIVLPVLVTACSAKKEEVKAEPIPVPKKEVKAEQKAAEVKEEKKAEVKTAPAAEKKAEVKTAPAAEKKAEVKTAPAAEKKAEVKPAPAAEKKAEVKPVEQAPVLPCKHTVQKGENLWKISVHYYGKGAKWPKILEANKAAIKNMDILTPGMVLNIPADK